MDEKDVVPRRRTVSKSNSLEMIATNESMIYLIQIRRNLTSALLFDDITSNESCTSFAESCSLANSFARRNKGLRNKYKNITHFQQCCLKDDFLDEAGIKCLFRKRNMSMIKPKIP